MRQGIFAWEEHLAGDHDVGLLAIDGRLADIDLVVGTEREGRVAIDDEAVLDGKAEGFADTCRFGFALGILESARHIDALGRSRFQQATSLDNEVLDGHVLRIEVVAGSCHFAMDGYGSHIIQVVVAGDVEDVVLLEHDVADGSVHDILDINRKDRACQVLVFALQHGTIGEGIAGESISSDDELLHGVDGSQLIGTGTIDGALDFDSVGVTLQDGLNLDGITIHGGEGAELVLANGANLVLVAVLTLDADAARICLVAETSSVGEEVLYRFAVLHLVAHRALDGSGEFDELLIGGNNDDIALFECDVALGPTVHDEVIDIEDSHIVTSTIEHNFSK